jgi:hypothetical protein
MADPGSWVQVDRLASQRSGFTKVVGQSKYDVNERIDWAGPSDLADPSLPEVGTLKAYWAKTPLDGQLPVNLAQAGNLIRGNRDASSVEQQSVSLEKLNLTNFTEWNIYGGYTNEARNPIELKAYMDAEATDVQIPIQTFGQFLGEVSDSVMGKSEVDDVKKRWDGGGVIPNMFHYAFFPAIGVRTGQSTVEYDKATNSFSFHLGSGIKGNQMVYGNARQQQRLDCVPYVAFYSTSMPGKDLLPLGCSADSWVTVKNELKNISVNLCVDLIASRDSSTFNAITSAINLANPAPNSYVWFVPMVRFKQGDIDAFAYRARFAINGPSLGAAVFAAVSGMPSVMYTGFVSAASIDENNGSGNVYRRVGDAIVEVDQPKAFDYLENVQFVGSKMWLAAMLRVPFVMPTNAAIKTPIGAGTTTISDYARRFANSTGQVLLAGDIYTTLDLEAGRKFVDHMTPFLMAPTMNGAMTLAALGSYYFGGLREISQRARQAIDKVAADGRLQRQAAKRLDSAYESRAKNAVLNYAPHPYGFRELTQEAKDYSVAASRTKDPVEKEALKKKAEAARKQRSAGKKEISKAKKEVDWKRRYEKAQEKFEAKYKAQQERIKNPKTIKKANVRNVKVEKFAKAAGKRMDALKSAKYAQQAARIKDPEARARFLAKEEKSYLGQAQHWNHQDIIDAKQELANRRADRANIGTYMQQQYAKTQPDRRRVGLRPGQIVAGDSLLPAPGSGAAASSTQAVNALGQPTAPLTVSGSYRPLRSAGSYLTRD